MGTSIPGQATGLGREGTIKNGIRCPTSKSQKRKKKKKATTDGLKYIYWERAGVSRGGRKRPLSQNGPGASRRGRCGRKKNKKTTKKLTCTTKLIETLRKRKKQVRGGGKRGSSRKSHEKNQPEPKESYSLHSVW